MSLRRLRSQLLTGIEGEVLEIGVGWGANLHLYRPAARITAVDIDRERLAMAAETVVENGLSGQITISCADAQHLPFAGDSFDCVVGTLVFCSIPNPKDALGEVKRVLRPDGRLLLLEHVRGLTPVMQRLTDWLHPLWFAIQGECHLNRETASTVAEAGFEVIETSTHTWGLLQRIIARPNESRSKSNAEAQRRRDFL
jgi:ubiquinone/menaquinone biosynthesis C-methylase UbiE